MSITAIPSATIATAKTLALDARTRAAGGDFSLSTDESAAVVSLATALKAAGLASPLDHLLAAVLAPAGGDGVLRKAAYTPSL